MKTCKSSNVLRTLAVLILVVLSGLTVTAQPWISYDDNTRYLALGDSLSAGYAAKPVTQGFVYRLYQSGVIDKLDNLLFCPAALPGASSIDVLQHQVPQVPLFFKNTGLPYRKVVTLTVGGNDLLSVLNPDGTVNFPAIPVVLGTYQQNLAGILGALASMPDVKVYVGNLYDPRLPVDGCGQLVDMMNQITGAVVSAFPGKAVLVDLHRAFDGRSGLLLAEKHGSSPGQIHPTSAGYNVMAEVFAASIRSN